MGRLQMRFRPVAVHVRAVIRIEQCIAQFREGLRRDAGYPLGHLAMIKAGP